MATSDYAFNQYNPYGASVWNGNGLYTTLSPDQQAILDQQENYSIALGKKLNQSLSGLSGIGIDESKLPTLDTNAGDSVYKAYMNRLQPQMNQQNESFRQQMANQGIAAGTQAYDNAFRNLSQQQNDLMLQGAANAANAQQNAYNTALNGQAQIGNTYLNQMNAMRNGMQVNNPTYANQGNPVATNTSQNNAQSNNTMNGLFSLGAAALPSVLSFWK